MENFLGSLHFLWSPLLHPMDATVTLSTLLNIFATLNYEFMLGVKRLSYSIALTLYLKTVFNFAGSTFLISERYISLCCNEVLSRLLFFMNSFINLKL